MGIWEGMKRGAKALVQGPGPQRYAAAGQPIRCTHCRHASFIAGSALMNTVGMTFLNLDWANKTATTLMCDGCGLVHWFVEPPTAL